jgi:hypothetical protein
LLLSSGSKSKPRKKPARIRGQAKDNIFIVTVFKTSYLTMVAMVVVKVVVVVVIIVVAAASVAFIVNVTAL